MNVSKFKKNELNFKVKHKKQLKNKYEILMAANNGLNKLFQINGPTYYLINKIYLIICIIAPNRKIE